MQLLTISNDAKTVKGEKQGYMTAIMYLAPYKLAGINICPTAETAGCWKGCLNTSGRGGIASGQIAPYGLSMPDNVIQKARINRTRFYADDRAGFITQLKKEITAFVKKADRRGLIPVIRLNGTSDIDWTIKNNGKIMQCFPDVQFYDYTKVMKRAYKTQPENYDLSLSYSQANLKYSMSAIRAHNDTGLNLVYVMRNEQHKRDIMALRDGVNRIDGDLTDLRFLDKAKSLVYLKAKGSARHDQSGFVLDYQRGAV